jgi:23S rRNA (uridine2552-2'-O)-methyltransferase
MATKRKADFYSHKAKTEGYPARSIYKLQEILQKYRLLKNTARVLDIGAAPGSFSQYLLKHLRGRGWVYGVDISSEITIPGNYNNFTFLQGDIFSDEVFTALVNWKPYDLVVSDAAPATSGNRLVDTYKSLAIAERVLIIAGATLAHNGNLIIKLFQGGEELKLMKKMKAWFKEVKGFKPKASRKESFEIYYLGFDFLGDNQALQAGG